MTYIFSKSLFDDQFLVIQLDFQKLQEIKRSEFLGISCDESNDVREKGFGHFGIFPK